MKLLDVDTELWTESHLEQLRQMVRERIPQIEIPPNASLEDLAVFVTDVVGYRVFATPQDIEAVLNANFGCLVDPDGV